MKTTITHPVNQIVSNQSKAKRIKLGLDVHAKQIVVVRQIDNATPQPAQRFSPAAFLTWAGQQLDLAEEVCSVYEAGPFGYGLHRSLLKLGIKNVVIRPMNLDELRRGVKTDKIDAGELCLRLDRYMAGNHHALAVIRVPSQEEEQQRVWTRLRSQLLKDRMRWEAAGRSALLYFGQPPSRATWWKPARWKALSVTLPESLRAQLEIYRELVLALDNKIRQLTASIEKQASRQPFGVGALTSEVLRREIGDWKRFNNRREVASLTGLCPGVYSSGQMRREGSITKHGNPRIRSALIELAWRLVRFQPDYQPVKKWRRCILAHPKSRAVRKKAIVALARRTAIDLWRFYTGRASAEQLGLKVVC